MKRCMLHIYQLHESVLEQNIELRMLEKYTTHEEHLIDYFIIIIYIVDMLPAIDTN